MTPKKSDNLLSSDVYKDIFKLSDKPIVVHDLNGKIIDLNTSAIRFLGNKKSDLIGNRISQFTQVSQKNIFESKIKELSKKRKVKFNSIFKTKKGKQSTVEITSKKVKNDRGQIIFSVINDIQEISDLLKKLAKSEERYKDLFIRNPHPMWIYDIKTFKFLDVNSAAIRKYGYSRNEFLSMTIKDIRPPEDIQDLLKNVSNIGTGLDEAGVWRHIKKNGHLIFVEITSHFMMYKGKPAEVVLAYDITQPKTVEQKSYNFSRRLQILHAIDQKIISAKSFEEIASFALNKMSSLISYDRAMIILYDLNLNKAKIIASKFKDNSKKIKKKSFKLSKNRWSKDLLSKKIKKVENIPKASIKSKTLKSFIEKGVKSYLNVPIYFKNDILGSLNIGIVRKGHFSNEVIDIAREIADLLAVSIQQTRQRFSIIESEGRFRNLFNRVPVGLYRTTPDGKFLDVNENLCLMLGFKNKKFLLGANLKDFYVNPKDRKKWQKKLDCDGMVREFEVKLRRNDNSVIWVQNNSIASCDSNQNTIYCEGSLEDITERKWATDALRKSKEKYRLLFDEAPYGVVMIEEDKTVSMINKRLLDLFGYKYEEIIGKSFVGFLPKNQKKRIIKIHENRRKELSVPNEYETEIYNKQGKAIPVLITVNYIKETKQGIVYIIDLSEVKELERKTLLSAEKYRTLFEYSVNPLIVEKEDRTISLINSEFEKLSKYKKEEIENKKKSDIFVEPKYLTEFKKSHKLRRTNPEKLPLFFETIFINKNGEKKDVLIRENLIPGLDERIVSIVDISDRKRIEEEIKKRNRELTFYNKILSTVSQMTNIEKIFNYSLETLRDFTFFDVGFISIKNEIEGFLVFYEKDTSENLKKSLDQLQKMVYEECINQVSKICRIDDFSQKVKSELNKIGFNDILTIIIDPYTIYRKGKGLGAFFLLSKEKFRLSPDDIDLLSVIGNQLGVLVENIRLFDRTKIRAEQLRILNRISLEIVAEHDLEKTLRILADSARYLTNSRYCIIRGHQEEPKYVPKIYSGFSSRGCRVKGEFNPDSLAVKFLKTGKIVCLSDISKHPASRGLPRGHLKLRGLLGVPVLDSRGRAICGILLSDKMDGSDYSQIDIEVIKALASIAAIAIENSILFMQMRNKTSELENAYEDLKEADYLKSEFVTIASHELRSPLTTIKGYVEIIKDGILGEVQPKIKEKLNIIEREIKNLTLLADDLLDLSRIESKKYPIAKRRFNIKRLVGEVVEDHEINIENKSIRVKINIPKELKYIVADRSAIKRVLNNLIDNAIKNNIINGFVYIVIKKEKGRIHFIIKDTGIGISKKELARIFEKFFIAESSLSRGRKGIGLGLSIVKGLIEAHEGEVWAESQINKGSEFHFTIPIKQ